MTVDEIGLLGHLQGEPKSISELAEATGIHGPTLARFVRALAAVDLLAVDGEGRVLRGPLAEGLREAVRIDVENYRAWCELPYTLRTGKPAFNQVFGCGLYEYLDGEPEISERLHTGLAAVTKRWISGVLTSVDFADDKTVADIGGGHGTFLAKLLKAHPHLQGILVDQAPVLSHAVAVLAAEGVQNRCRLEPANFLESVPQGANVSTLCNLLTDWDDKQASVILRNGRAAMEDGGRIVVVDRVMPPSDDPGHRFAAFLDIFFLVMEGGCIRTREEFSDLFESAGFGLARTVPLGGVYHVLEGR